MLHTFGIIIFFIWLFRNNFFLDNYYTLHKYIKIAYDNRKYITFNLTYNILRNYIKSFVKSNTLQRYNDNVYVITIKDGHNEYDLLLPKTHNYYSHIHLENESEIITLRHHPRLPFYCTASDLHVDLIKASSLEGDEIIFKENEAVILHSL